MINLFTISNNEFDFHLFIGCTYTTPPAGGAPEAPHTNWLTGAKTSFDSEKHKQIKIPDAINKTLKTIRNKKRLFFTYDKNQNYIYNIYR